MRPGVLARNEALKTSRRLSFWVSLLAFGGLLTIIVGEAFYRGLARPEVAFTLPAGWVDALGDIGPLPGIFGAVAVVLLITSEFSWRTARQNVIDGLSKEEFFVGKLLAWPVVVLCFVALALLLIGGFGLLGSRLAGAEGPFFRHTDLALVGGVTLCALGYSSVACFSAFLTRSSGAALGLFFLYVAFVDQILAPMLARVGEAGKVAARLLPRNVFDALVRETQFDLAARAAAIERALQAGRDAPTYLDTGVLVWMCCFWVLFFAALSFWVYERRDL